MDKVTKEKATSHPLEGVLNIEEHSTMVEYTEFVPAEVVSMPTYDEKDDEIESKLEEIYTIAIGSASTINDEVERVEGKYKARVGEIAAAMLNVALGAVQQKSALKMHKDKLVTAKAAAGTPHTVNQNLIVADRNEVLRAMFAEKDKPK